MTWDPRRIQRAVLGVLIVGAFVTLILARAFGLEGADDDLIAIMALPVGTVLGHFFKADKDK